ncbi:MAG: polysaccharide deacetylase family protein [Myxococcales bacterium]|nr:polysaccharide deacetylase family protein [Myxococcales bacterium]
MAMILAALATMGCSGSGAGDRLVRDRDRPEPTTTDSSSSTTPEPTEPDPISADRRWDCSGLDPADPAPLGGRVALTFDDGPTTTHTASIVGTLRAWDVPATFFIVGEMLADPDSWELVEDMLDDPLFDVANHSWDHADLSSLSRSALEAEVDDTTDLIETFGITPRFFRFPFGASTCDAVDLARDRGMHVAGWHVDTADWCYAAIGTTGTCRTTDYWRVPTEHQSDMIGFTMEQVRRFDGGVILLHDIHAYTANTLPDLLEALDDEGFTIVPLHDLDAFPRLNADDPIDLPYLGEACSVDDDACWQIEYQSWCEPTHPEDTSSSTGICTLPCEGFCLDRPGAATTFCATVDPGAGQCVGRSDSENDWCDAIDGTVEQELERWVGSSGVSAARADVCVPPGW